MKLVTAPDKINLSDYSERIFLAGGITNCDIWQDKVVEHLYNSLAVPGWDTSELLIFNPRRENFPIDDPKAAYEQIKWEFCALDACNIFTMYFCNSESVQPICMYELGRNIAKIENEYKITARWKQRIIVSVEDGYKRAQDVIIQCGLAGIFVYEHATPETHAQAIAKAWVDLYGESMR